MVRIGKNSRHLRVFHIILHKKKKTKRSWTNYIRDCVKWIIKTHHIDISNKIENSGGDFSSYRQRDKTLVWSLLLHSYANRTAARTHARTYARLTFHTHMGNDCVRNKNKKKTNKNVRLENCWCPNHLPPPPYTSTDSESDSMGLQHITYFIAYCFLHSLRLSCIDKTHPRGKLRKQTDACIDQYYATYLFCLFLFRLFYFCVTYAWYSYIYIYECCFFCWFSPS